MIRQLLVYVYSSLIFFSALTVFNLTFGRVQWTRNDTQTKQMPGLITLVAEIGDSKRILMRPRR